LAVGILPGSVKSTALARRLTSRFVFLDIAIWVGITFQLGVWIMSKVLSALLIIVATFSIALSQESSRNNDTRPSQGIAPKVPNGIGRADVRVFDEKGNPIRNAYVKLESTRTDGFFCESWGETDANGVIALLPIHMGNLKLKVKAKGYRPQELDVPADGLGDPVHVTLKKK
jgi:hypothetical protein